MCHVFQNRNGANNISSIMVVSYTCNFRSEVMVSEVKRVDIYLFAFCRFVATWRPTVTCVKVTHLQYAQCAEISRRPPTSDMGAAVCSSLGKWRYHFNASSTWPGLEAWFVGVQTSPNRTSIRRSDGDRDG